MIAHETHYMLSFSSIKSNSILNTSGLLHQKREKIKRSDRSKLFSSSQSPCLRCIKEKRKGILKKKIREKSKKRRGLWRKECSQAKEATKKRKRPMLKGYFLIVILAYLRGLLRLIYEFMFKPKILKNICSLPSKIIMPW